MSDPNTPVPTVKLSQEEYRSLRETVQRRGNLRVIIALATWSVWAVLATWGWTNGPAPLFGAIPLVVLMGGFELVLSLHTGVERIGRYLQVMHETGRAESPAWEHIAMNMGGRWLSPGGLDPLFTAVFLGAALLNTLPTIAGGSTAEIGAMALMHLLFAVRLARARQFVDRQRAHDLAALRSVISSNSLVSNIQQQR